MSHNRLRSPLVRWFSLPIALGALTITLPAQALILFPAGGTLPALRDYQRCARNLLALGISEDATAAACAEAVQPQDLSRCVERIAGGTELAATDALSGCTQVRRPVALAECVVDIDNERDEAIASLDILDYCRRSLLPDRFSHCVLGLSREIPLATVVAMDACISVSDRPENVLPNFIPAGTPEFDLDVDTDLQLERLFQQ